MQHTEITQLEKHRTWKRTTRETANNSRKIIKEGKRNIVKRRNTDYRRN
jgi:hypothetical protein